VTPPSEREALAKPETFTGMPKAPSLRELANPEDLSEGVQARKKSIICNAFSCFL
jgi:hypothetical protein